MVRPLVDSDKAQWRELWDGYNRFYERWGKTALSESTTTTLWQRLFDPAEPMHALVAEREGLLLGLVHYVYHRVTTATTHICYLHDLFTLEEVRGQGVGRALIEAVYAEARRAGSHRVYWQTHESNHQARALYEQVADLPGFLIYRKDL